MARSSTVATSAFCGGFFNGVGIVLVHGCEYTFNLLMDLVHFMVAPTVVVSQVHGGIHIVGIFVVNLFP